MATYTPLSTRITQSIAAADVTDAVMNDLTALVPKFAAINRATTGELLAAVANKKLRILAMWFTVAADATVALSSNTGGTVLAGAATIKAGGGIVLPYNPKGWMETAATNTNFYVTLGTACQISGSITYIEV